MPDVNKYISVIGVPELVVIFLRLNILKSQ